MRLVCVGVISALLIGPALARPVEFISAVREIDATTLIESKSAIPPTEFAVFSDIVNADGEFWGPLATAVQRSTVTPWLVDVVVDAEADTETNFPVMVAGTSRSEFELAFEISEPVRYELSGFVAGYDGTGRFSLTNVVSASATTVFLDPEDPFDTTPGSRPLDRDGILEPGSYTLRASGEASPTLGGWGGGEVQFTLQILPLSLPAWLDFHALAPDTDLQSDDDHDLVPLIIEYAFRYDPNAADAGAATLGFEFDAVSRVAKMTYPGQRADLVYIAERSTDLVNWSNEGVTQFDAGLEVLARYTVPVDQDHIAMRLRIEVPAAD